MQLETMFISHDGPIATLHLNRTERLNAFGNQGTIDLNKAADALAANDDVRIVIITGEGRAFSTGIDLKQLAAGEIDMTYHHRWEAALRKFELMHKVVISAINGYCIGGGLQLTLAGDIRLAAESAKFGLPAIKEGLVPGMGVWRLPRYIGMGRAKQLILSGEMIDARTALAIGMVDQVVEDAALQEAAKQTAERYLQSPWSSVLLSKQMTNRAFDLPFDAFLEEYFAAQTDAMRSEDHVAAMRAYRDEQARKR
ncbi:MAG TPA: enoyl-CoA hydratase/isomerase family protein [Roseiflexaceae bacterium]|nr:enoyl-CoA hydratase/isomerase family protein [Roseiflexaceae bacterium]